MAAVQFLCYTNLVINYRAVAAGYVGWSMATDALAVLIGYFIVQKVAKAEGWDTLIGMMIGGTLAAWAGIAMTSMWQ
jgi:hypothetical protein